MGDGVHLESRRVRGLPHVDRPLVAEEAIDAVGYRPPQAIGREIMDVDLLGLPPPGPSSVLEVADQFLFLGVDADYGLSRRHKLLDLPGQVGKLDLPVGVAAASFALFGIDAQTVLELHQ